VALFTVLFVTMNLQLRFLWSAIVSSSPPNYNNGSNHPEYRMSLEVEMSQVYRKKKQKKKKNVKDMLKKQPQQPLQQQQQQQQQQPPQNVSGLPAAMIQEWQLHHGIQRLP
jgi:hypothetical protein